MKIDFTSIDEQIIPNFKGGEKEIAAKMFFDGRNRIMKARIKPGASIGLHTHEDSSEIMFITKGSVHILFDGERMDLKEGDIHYCPKGHTHSLINDSLNEVRFTAVVSLQ